MLLGVYITRPSFLSSDVYNALLALAELGSCKLNQTW